MHAPSVVLVHHADWRSLGARVPLPDGARILLGRDASCPFSELRDDPRLSRRHAEIRRAGSRMDVVDLGSKNGTMVNEQSIEKRRLRDGDLVGVGNVLFYFTTETPESELSQDTLHMDDDSIFDFRPEEVTHLAAAHLAEYSPVQRIFTRGLSLALTRYRWPGQLSELQATIERIADQAVGERRLDVPPWFLAKLNQTVRERVGKEETLSIRVR